jgi:hypothetical protein
MKKGCGASLTVKGRVCVNEQKKVEIADVVKFNCDIEI